MLLDACLATRVTSVRYISAEKRQARSNLAFKLGILAARFELRGPTGHGGMRILGASVNLAVMMVFQPLSYLDISQSFGLVGRSTPGD